MTSLEKTRLGLGSAANSSSPSSVVTLLTVYQGACSPCAANVAKASATSMTCGEAVPARWTGSAPGPAVLFGRPALIAAFMVSSGPTSSLSWAKTVLTELDVAFSRSM